MSFIDHLLLGIAAIAVWGASFRLASSFVDRGLERILVGATFFTAAIVVETMVLGLFELGGTQAALVLAAVSTGLLAFLLIPRSGAKISEEVADWLEQTPTMAIVAVSTAMGVGVVWAGWALWSPVVGVDGVYYHLPQMVRWVHEGTPGSVDPINYIYLVGNYPLTNAVAQTWGLGLSRSMVMVSIWPVFNMAVLCLAGWVGLKRMGLSSSVRVLAILAVASVPVVVIQLAGPLNDLPALSWLACGAALVVCSRDEHRLLIASSCTDEICGRWPEPSRSALGSSLWSAAFGTRGRSSSTAHRSGHGHHRRGVIRSPSSCRLTRRFSVPRAIRWLEGSVCMPALRRVPSSSSLPRWRLRSLRRIGVLD